MRRRTDNHTHSCMTDSCTRSRRRDSWTRSYSTDNRSHSRIHIRSRQPTLHRLPHLTGQAAQLKFVLAEAFAPGAAVCERNEFLGRFIEPKRAADGYRAEAEGAIEHEWVGEFLNRADADSEAASLSTVTISCRVQPFPKFGHADGACRRR
jgi:hypothetical protein